MLYQRWFYYIGSIYRAIIISICVPCPYNQGEHGFNFNFFTFKLIQVSRHIFYECFSRHKMSSIEINLSTSWWNSLFIQRVKHHFLMLYFILGKSYKINIVVKSLFTVNMLYFRYQFGELQYLTDHECQQASLFIVPISFLQCQS